MARCVIKDFGSNTTRGRECYSGHRGFRSVPRILLRTSCKSTENLAKVKIAVLNVFPDARFGREDDIVEAESASVERLRERVRTQKIRDTARSVLLRGRTANTLRFALNKQAAYVGAVSFAAEASPLGDIEVLIETEDVDRLVDDIAESTLKKPGEALR